MPTNELLPDFRRDYQKLKEEQKKLFRAAIAAITRFSRIPNDNSLRLGIVMHEIPSRWRGRPRHHRRPLGRISHGRTVRIALRGYNAGSKVNDAQVQAHQQALFKHLKRADEREKLTNLACLAMLPAMLAFFPFIALTVPDMRADERAAGGILLGIVVILAVAAVAVIGKALVALPHRRSSLLTLMAFPALTLVGSAGLAMGLLH